MGKWETGWGNAAFCWGNAAICWGNDAICWGNEANLLGKWSKWMGKWSKMCWGDAQKVKWSVPLPTTSIKEFWECYLFLYQKEIFTNRCKCQVYSFQCPFINYWATKSLDLYRILYNCFDFTSLNFVLMCVPVKSKKPSNHTILIPGFFLVFETGSNTIQKMQVPKMGWDQIHQVQPNHRNIQNHQNHKNRKIHQKHQVKVKPE